MTIDLQAMSCFEGCGRRELKTVQRCSTPVLINAGRFIPGRAVAGDQVVVVGAGTVAIERDGTCIATATRGDVISGLAGTACAPVTLHALDDCELLVISRL